MISNAVKELQSAKNQRQVNIRSLEAEIAQIDAAIAALSISGFPTDKFIFLGFPPHKNKRQKSNTSSS